MARPLRRCPRGLPQAAGADRSSAGFLVRPPPRLDRLDAPGVDERQPGRPAHHRTVRRSRAALCREISVGTVHRRARRAFAVATAGSATWVAPAVAARVDGNGRVAGLLRSGGVAVDRRWLRLVGFHRFGDARHRRRRVPCRKSARRRTSGRHGLLRRRLSRRRARGWRWRAAPCRLVRAAPVSYTHLDVYKRQVHRGSHQAAALAAGSACISHARACDRHAPAHQGPEHRPAAGTADRRLPQAADEPVRADPLPRLLQRDALPHQQACRALRAEPARSGRDRRRQRHRGAHQQPEPQDLAEDHHPRCTRPGGAGAARAGCGRAVGGGLTSRCEEAMIDAIRRSRVKPQP